MTQREPDKMAIMRKFTPTCFATSFSRTAGGAMFHNTFFACLAIAALVVGADVNCTRYVNVVVDVVLVVLVVFVVLDPDPSFVSGVPGPSTVQTAPKWARPRKIARCPTSNEDRCRKAAESSTPRREVSRTMHCNGTSSSSRRKRF